VNIKSAFRCPALSQTIYHLHYLGTGTKVTGKMEIKVIPGKESGKFVVILDYYKR